MLEKIQLNIHLSLCSHCSDYNKKAELLDILAKKSVQENERKIIYNPSEIEDFKKRIYKKINL